MNLRNHIKRSVLFLFISAGCLNSQLIYGNKLTAFNNELNNSIFSSDRDSINKLSKETVLLNEQLKNILLSSDTKKGKPVVEKILQNLNSGEIINSVLSESYYFIGTYHLLIRSYNEAIRYLNLCISIKEKNNEYDQRLAKALSNLAVSYYNFGNLTKHESYALKSLEILKKIYGESNPALINSYLSLIIAYTDLTEYEKAIYNSNIALSIASKNQDKVPPSVISDIYYSLGVCYARLGDFSKAKIYLDKSELIYNTFSPDRKDSLINLMNGLAITYNALGMTSQAGAYYEKGVTLAISGNSSLAYNIINSYCLFLAHENNALKGERLLKNSLERAKANYKFNPRNYFEVLNNYASYLSENRIDLKKSLECYEKCIEYVKENNQDLVLKTSVYLGYSLALKEAGDPYKALEIVQSLLLSGMGKSSKSAELIEPTLESLKPDITSLKILRAKYDILWDIYNKHSDLKILEAAAQTSELIVAILDQVRINISEEDSRLILGDRYRSSYLKAIRDFNLLYRKTADPHYLEMAFEYSEKSKVAGLLASTRELKATQFNIPSEIGDFEKRLQREISLFNGRISEESSRENPDATLITKLKENLLASTRIRDSLILIFEKQYPDYFAIKYNSHVVGLKDIPSIIGTDGNYINYVVSDKVLYTFIVNRKHQQLLAVNIDSSFFNDIRHFRSLLSMPSSSDNASLKLKEFQNTGYRLYKTLIDPLRPYLISDKLFISPDNILSYLPFETILVSQDSAGPTMYKGLNYLMYNYDISYIYSATFRAESEKKEQSTSNKLVAFAPDYPSPIDIQSALMLRQAKMGFLNDLPYARQEAEYVSELTGGKLYENSNARESVFKKESGKYDIIHLSMHTLLNDKDPMRSTLIFSQMK